MAAQVVHFPKHSQCKTSLAPDPEDIVWDNMGMSTRERWVRQILAQLVMIGGLLFWGSEYFASYVKGVISYIRQVDWKTKAYWLLNRCLSLRCTSSGRRSGQSAFLRGDQACYALARQVDRTLSYCRGAGANHSAFYRYHHLQRSFALSAGMALLFSRIPVQVADLQLDLEKVSSTSMCCG